MKMGKFDHRDVYANRVRIYCQIGMIYELEFVYIVVKSEGVGNKQMQ